MNSILALVLFVGLSVQNPYIPRPKNIDYCQAALGTNEEVERVQSHLNAGLELIQVQILTRHGDRAPIEWFHTPVYNDTAIWDCKVERLSYENFDNEYSTQNRLTSERYMYGRQANKGNCGMGALTQKGAHQHVHNGQKFRAMYIETAKFLSEEWNNEEVYVRSGDELRLVESAQSLFAGLYPPKHDEKKEQRQRVDLIDSSFDNMTPDIVPVCPFAAELKALSHETEVYKNYTAKNDALSAQLEEIFQVEYVSVNSLADLIRCRGCHDYDYTYGGLLSEDMVEEILASSHFSFTYFPNFTLANRYGMGSFVWEMTQYFEDHINQKNPYKFVLFSGHDSSVWPLLDTLNIYDGVWPPLASQVVFEFYKDKSGVYYLEIIYNARSLTQYMPGCGGGDLCKYSDFLTSTKDIRVSVEEFWRECDYFGKGVYQGMKRDKNNE